MHRKKIVFLTGTRADFGKLKSLMKITQNSEKFKVHIFATGMHMSAQYGKTINEIYKSNFKNIYPYINHDSIDNMDRTLARTIEGFSMYIQEAKPDIIVIHGDRVEALAGAIVGSLNNILVAHIEGGELSGTIDELIRHSVSKLAHIHFVANKGAKRRLIQMGERPHSIFTIGSPDLDLMNPENLPSLQEVKQYYDIQFSKYSILLYHPVTTEHEITHKNAEILVESLLKSNKNYIVIYPNNDIGSYDILREYKKLENNTKFKTFPSIRFEYFLTFLYNSEFIIGNSSAGIREAPFYNIPTIDIGTRQTNRSKGETIIHCNHKINEILSSIDQIKDISILPTTKLEFGDGKSDEKFLTILNSHSLWATDCQKQFQDSI